MAVPCPEPQSLTYLQGMLAQSQSQGWAGAEGLSCASSWGPTPASLPHPRGTSCSFYCPREVPPPHCPSLPPSSSSSMRTRRDGEEGAGKGRGDSPEPLGSSLPSSAAPPPSSIAPSRRAPGPSRPGETWSWKGFCSQNCKSPGLPQLPPLYCLHLNFYPLPCHVPQFRPLIAHHFFTASSPPHL